MAFGVPKNDATATELQKYLSLCGPTVETIKKKDNDYIYDVEITSNRIDSASVYGIAQEASAILPQFNRKAVCKLNPLKDLTFKTIKKQPSVSKNLSFKIDKKLCPRFTAVVLSDVSLTPSPTYIQKRLKASGINTINSVVDISNYLMISLGQPVHMFDYDAIAGGRMVLRSAKKGERLKILDGTEVLLETGDIIIEDATGNVIDLCGIMGGLDSSISENTKTIVFTVQSYDKRAIRSTTMRTGIRTSAATYFEKGLDPNRVEPTVVAGLKLLLELTGGKVDSPIYDIYPSKVNEKEVCIKQVDIDSIIGIHIAPKTIVRILTSLGFGVKQKKDSYLITIPTYRIEDIDSKEDIVEEVARVYGYFNLPNNLSPMVHVLQPKEVETQFILQSKIKNFLKHVGFHESMNYSMISKDLIDHFDLDSNSMLRLSDTISTEIEYLRTSLIPSLSSACKQNEGFKAKLNLFELANIYLPQKNALPKELLTVTIATNTDFFALKGVVESLLDEIHVYDLKFEKGNSQFFSKHVQSRIVDKQNAKVGVIGMLHPRYKDRLGLQRDLFFAELSFDSLKKNAQSVARFTKINPYAVITLDVNIPHTLPFSEIKQMLLKRSKLLHHLEVVDSYKNTLLLRCYFSSTDRNITEQEAKDELARILKFLKS